MQKKNVAIVNCLSKFRSGVEEILTGVDPNVEANISESLSEVDKQVKNAINPLLSSIQDAVEAIVLTIHKEDFSADEAIGQDALPEANKNACSLYMKELQGFISRVAVDFLQDFLCQDFISSCVLPLAEKIVHQFVLHASLVRPLGRSGQMRLASDCAQLELALEPLVKDKLSAIGDAYSQLRAFRSLLFMQPEDFASCPGLGKTLRVSTALHLLFSKAPPELR